MKSDDLIDDIDELLASSFEEFTTQLRAAVKLSESREDTYHTGRQRRVLAVFAKTILHGMALEALLDAPIRNRAGLLDHFTAGTITRAIIDASLMTMYLSEPSLSYKQWLLRREVLHLHELTNRKRFLEPSGKLNPELSARLPFFKNYEADKKDSRARILGYCEELGIDPAKSAKLQEGQFVFTEGGRGAAREAGWDVDAHEFEQAYYSAYVHTHPVSFMKMDEQQISWSVPSDFQKNFVSMALSSAARYFEWSNARIDSFTGVEERDPLAQNFREAS